MLINKIIEVGINVHNCINIYTDPENIKNILADRYEGKCFRGCWIKSINKILMIGECVINQDGVPNFGTVPVIFEATAIVYAVGEIINGCVVKNKDKSGIIICGTDIASIMLNSHKSLESVTKGQIISVRVVGARYNQAAVKISVHAVPFMFQDRPIVYKIGSISEATKDLITNVLTRIEFEESEMENLKKEKARAWTFFDKLLYAYKEKQSVPTGARELNIVDIAKSGIERGVVYLTRDNRINLSTPTVHGYAAAPLPAKAIVRSELPTSNILILLLEDYCAHLRTIREMVNIYSTEELLESHSNLWKIFAKSKF
jgi:hypothetical protein